MSNKKHTCAGILSLAIVGVAQASGHDELTLSDADFSLTTAIEHLIHQPDESAGAPVPTAEAVAKPGFGRAGSSWLTFGAGYANNFDEETDLNGSIAWSRFLADEIEFSLEGGGWYFDQEGQNTGGLSAIFYFRWHAIHDEAFDWSLYADAGIGLLAGFDEVPDGGTGLAFMPRAGVGFTKEINDEGWRWQLGARWHHISNGRFEGDERNPSRDSVMIYTGIIIPF